MSKLYTLEECFYQADQQFPFEVTMHLQSKPIKLKFVKRTPVRDLSSEEQEKIIVHGEYIWHHSNSENHFRDDPYTAIHAGYSMGRFYEYKETRFKNELDEVINGA